MQDYLKFVQKDEEESEDNFCRMTFPEQSISPYLSKSTKQIFIGWQEEPDNEGADICRRKSKILFNKHFHNKVFDEWRYPNPDFSKHAEDYSVVDHSFLIHYQTETAIIFRKQGKYL